MANTKRTLELEEKDGVFTVTIDKTIIHATEFERLIDDVERELVWEFGAKQLISATKKGDDLLVVYNTWDK